MQISTPLVAHRESSEAIEPGQRPLHDPPVPPEALARVDAATGDAREDATRTAGGAAAREVVAFVRMQLVRAMAWPTSPTARLADRLDRVQGGFQQPRVMHVGR